MHGHGELTDSQIAIILVKRHEIHGHLAPRSSKRAREKRRGSEEDDWSLTKLR